MNDSEEEKRRDVKEGRKKGRVKGRRGKVNEGTG